MPDITTIQDEIRARLVEVEGQIEPLRLEADQLTKLLATFGPQTADTAPAAKPVRSRTRTPRKATTNAGRPATAPRAKRGRPAGGGNRAAQAIDHIVKRPGITASELAAAMGIGPNYLYRVLPQLQRESKITKQGKGYHPVVGDVAETIHTNGQGVTA